MTQRTRRATTTTMRRRERRTPRGPRAVTPRSTDGTSSRPRAVASLAACGSRR